MPTTNIPAPRSAFIDERTGLMSREWYLFFLQLFNLTGAGSSTETIPEIVVALRLRSTATALDGQDGEDGMMGIPGPQGKAGAAGAVIPGMDGQDAEYDYPIGRTGGVSSFGPAAVASITVSNGIVVAIS